MFFSNAKYITTRPSPPSRTMRLLRYNRYVVFKKLPAERARANYHPNFPLRWTVLTYTTTNAWHGTVQSHHAAHDRCDHHDEPLPRPHPSSCTASCIPRIPQLAMYSIALYLPVALREEGPIFAGWSKYTVMLAILGSAGGILVALTMKYTDAVLKTFATSGAIIVTAVAGNMFLDAPLDIPIAIGAACTVLSLLNYSDDGGDSTSTSPAALSAVSNDKTKGATPSRAIAGGEGGERPSPLGVGGAENLDESNQPLIARSGSSGQQV